MKTWLKVTLIALGVGVVLMVSGLAMGAQRGVYFDQKGKISLENDQKEIVSKTDIGEIKEIKVDVYAAEVKVVPGSGYGYKTESYNRSAKIVSTFEDGKLIIRQKATETWGGINLNFFRGGDIVTVYLPAGASLDSLRITANAGRVEVTDVSAQTVNLGVTAGSITLDRIKTPDLAVSATTGSIDATDLFVSNSADVSVVTGSIRLIGNLSGNIRVSSVTGEIVAKDQKPQSAFTLSMSRVTGDLRLNGDTVSGDVFGSGPNRMDLSTTTGSISADFGAN